MEILKLLQIIVVVTALLSLEALSWGKNSGEYSGYCVDNIWSIGIWVVPERRSNYNFYAIFRARSIIYTN